MMSWSTLSLEEGETYQVEDDPRYVHIEDIQILALLTTWGSLGNKFLLDRFGELNLEE